jgi:hypothetical protein
LLANLEIEQRKGWINGKMLEIWMSLLWRLVALLALKAAPGDDQSASSC